MNPPDSPVTTIQREILAALRAGAEFRTAHKEGGTVICWKRGRFIRADYGDWNERAEYTDEAAFLAFLRRFFEWESTGPQREDLPEPERWRNIQRLLDPYDTSHGSSPQQVSPLWKMGAFVIAAIAVVLAFYLRGRLPGSAAPAPPQKIDTFKGTPDKFPN